MTKYISYIFSETFWYAELSWEIPGCVHSREFLISSQLPKDFMCMRTKMFHPLIGFTAWFYQSEERISRGGAQKWRYFLTRSRKWAEKGGCTLLDGGDCIMDGLSNIVDVLGGQTTHVDATTGHQVHVLLLNQVLHLFGCKTHYTVTECRRRTKVNTPYRKRSTADQHIRTAPMGVNNSPHQQGQWSVIIIHLNEQMCIYWDGLFRYAWQVRSSDVPGVTGHSYSTATVKTALVSFTDAAAAW